MKSLIALGITVSFLSTDVALAADRDHTLPLLSAPASNPDTMGWMQGFPPAPDETIRFTDPDYTWWINHDDHGAFAARGVHGQTIWIAPVAQMVIVHFASSPVAADAASDPTSLPAFRTVADYLMERDRGGTAIATRQP